MDLSASSASLPGWALPALLALVVALGLGLLGLLWQRGLLLRSLASAHSARTGASAVPGLLSGDRVAQALDDAVARCDRDAGTLCLLLVNLDNLGAVNDGYGHHQADQLITEAVQRLRQLAGADTALARMGGVEFLLLAPVDLAAACDLASEICRTLARPYAVPGRADLAMSCSIGLAAYPTHGARPRLVGHAVAAMRQVKQAGGGDYMVFDPKMAVDLREQAELLADLRQAVPRGQLELYYQPKVDARNLQITAAEALLRWHHPRRGMISPALFIPLAERHGLIGAIGNWVIDDATRQAADWRALGLRMRVAINISPYQMRQDDLVDRLQAALARHQLHPGRFTCEITESVAMEDTQVTQRSFERMRRAGLHVSIDDFGVGQASLSYLRRLPAAELKIDASFVQDLGQNDDARAIIDAVVKLAHALGLRVVAEGVETALQRDLLVQLDCDELQGFLFAKPMAAAQLAVWAQLADEQPPPQAVHFRDSLFQDTLPAEV
ncbi:MAG: bifunctional diguanylate cyclase/phosphodiesterase [Pseudomonadota bacterium]